MRVKSYSEAVRLANSVGLDAAKRRAKKAGRKVLSAADYDHAVDVMETFLTDLGFDVRGWGVLAGVPRNEPPEAKPAKRSKGRLKAKSAVQLSFAFA